MGVSSLQRLGRRYRKKEMNKPGNLEINGAFGVRKVLECKKVNNDRFAEFMIMHEGSIETQVEFQKEELITMRDWLDKAITWMGEG